MFVWFPSVFTLLLSTAFVFCCAKSRKLKAKDYKLPDPKHSISPVPDSDRPRSVSYHVGTTTESDDVQPRVILPSEPGALDVYKKIVMGKTRPMRDNETVEDCKSDWGEVQVVDKGKPKKQIAAPAAVKSTKESAKEIDSKRSAKDLERESKEGVIIEEEYCGLGNVPAANNSVYM